MKRKKHFSSNRVRRLRLLCYALHKGGGAFFSQSCYPTAGVLLAIIYLAQPHPLTLRRVKNLMEVLRMAALQMDKSLVLRHRRSQEGTKGAMAPQIFRKYSHFVL